jgi:hypothetical protein
MASDSRLSVTVDTANHDQFIHSAEVCTLYPLDSTRRLRRSLSDEVTYTQRQAVPSYHKLHLLALHGRGSLHRTQLSQSPYGQRLYMEVTSHQVRLIFLSLDGAHLRSEGLNHDVLYTTKSKPLGVQPGLALSQGTSHPGSTPCPPRGVFYLRFC